jgi:hypothetical protein
VSRKQGQYDESPPPKIECSGLHKWGPILLRIHVLVYHAMQRILWGIRSI